MFLLTKNYLTRSARLTKRRVLLAVGVIVLLLSTVVAWDIASILNPKSPGVDDIGALVGLTFPPQSQILHLEENPWGHTAGFVAAVEMPPNSADGLLASVQAMRNEDVHVHRSKPMPAWWAAVPEPPVIQRQATPNATYVHVIICRGPKRDLAFIEYDGD